MQLKTFYSMSASSYVDHDLCHMRNGRQAFCDSQHWCLLQGSGNDLGLMAMAASNQQQLHPAFRRTGTVAARTLASPTPS